MTSRNYPYTAWWVDDNQRPVQCTITHAVVGATDLEVTRTGKVRHVDDLFGTRELALANSLVKVEARIAEITRMANRLLGQQRRLRAHIKEGDKCASNIG